jgi:predicted ATPase
MIKELKIKNFKAFDECHLKLAPLTILVGANNSGKSSILQSILLLKQTYEYGHAEIPLILNEKYYDFGTYEDLIHKNDITNKFYLSVTSNSTTLEFFFSFRKRLKEIIIEKYNLYIKENDKKIKHIVSSSITRSYRQKVLYKPINFVHTTKNVNYFDDPLMIYHLPMTKYNNVLTSRKFKYISKIIQRDIFDSFAHIYYLGPLREYPLRTYAQTAVKYEDVGKMGEHTFPIIASLKRKKDKESKLLRQALSKWLKQLGVAKDVIVDQLSPRHIEIRIINPFTGVAENIDDVGFGISQVIPVIIECLYIPKKSTLLIEQPEIHLHPHSQAELGSLFTEVSRDKQLIIETHSEHLILRIQRLIAERKMNPSAVRIYYVDCANRKEKVKYLPIGPDGYFKEEWPKGFFPERYHESKALASAASKYHAR